MPLQVPETCRGFKQGLAQAVNNLFIYQARVWPGPSRVSNSPVSAGNVICEAFVLMGVNWLMLYSISFLEESECVEKLEMM